MKRKITIISGSRAEWGLLKPLWEILNSQSDVELGLIVTGSHLDQKGDNSICEILADGAEITSKLEIFDHGGSQKSSADGKMFQAISQVFARLPELLRVTKPDLVVILGDRYEIFAVASVCRLMGVRIAHISGGELTFGAFDDSLRHCITKMSDLHFTATDDYRKRVIQLGESPESVFNVGEPGLFQMKTFPLLKRAELETELGIPLAMKFALLTFHPETCFPGKVLKNLQLVVSTLKTLLKDVLLIFTSANNDPEGEQINQELSSLAEESQGKMVIFKCLGRNRYLSLAALSEFVGGNSSSGIIEIPALKVPVLNFGSRQEGRPHGTGVIDVDYSASSIEQAIKLVVSEDFKKQTQIAANPYEGEESIKNIAEQLINTDLNQIPRSKRFFDLE